MLKSFNPIKSYETNEIHNVLSNLIQQTDKKFVIYNDNIGYYFSPLRSHKVTLWLDDPKHYNLFILLQDDVYMTKMVFKELLKGFHWDLIEHFEERAVTETNPIVTSFILFCLHNLSECNDGTFSMYSKERVSVLKNNIDNIDSFYIKDNEITMSNDDKSNFVVSIDKDFEWNEGLIITKSKRVDLELITRVGNKNIYYVPKRY